MVHKFSNYVQAKFPFLKGKKLLIAISGGVDSVVLTHLLSVLGFNISLAHCNFNLRGIESDLDESFVKQLAEKINSPIFTISFNTEEFAVEHKQSTQIAARELRYKWFQELIENHSFDYVLTAHHADDNLETFLINLTRGTGLDGLVGIPEINGNIVRPLLAFSRNEIISFAKEKKIQWREDISNASTKYTRNKIRHKVIPVLKEINPSLLETFEKTTMTLQESQQIVKDKIKNVSNDVIEKEASESSVILKINIQKINQLSNPKAYLYQLLKAYNFTEWNDVYNLLSAQTGKQIFSHTHILLKDRTFLLLSEKEKIIQKQFFFIDKNTSTIEQPICLSFKNDNCISNNKEEICIDTEQLIFPLKLRKWQHGDFFYPSGMTGKKKLSKYFKDEKFSLLQKQNTWILCNNDDAIIWVIGHRQDNRFLFKEASKKGLKVSFFTP